MIHVPRLNVDKNLSILICDIYHTDAEPNTLKHHETKIYLLQKTWYYLQLTWTNFVNSLEVVSNNLSVQNFWVQFFSFSAHRTNSVEENTKIRNVTKDRNFGAKITYVSNISNLHNYENQ